MIRRRASFDQSSVRLDFDTLPLYGREIEQELLREAYRGVCLGDTALVLLSGSTGKTELIQNMISQKNPSHRILRGAFSPDTRHRQPYGPIVDAYTKFFKTNKISSRLLRKALSKDQLIMTRLLPILHDACGSYKPPPLHDEENIHSHTFFNFMQAFCGLTRILATRDHPLLFFLDDLQWADESSLDLFSNLIQDPDSEHILFVGAYDGDLPPEILQKLKSAGGEETLEIKLEHLEFDCINQMICDSMDRLPQETEALTVIVYNKTEGDVMHARQFLEMLQDQGYLGYSLKLCQWFFDLDAIVTGTSRVNDVASTCRNRLKTLPDATLNIAQYAAFLGIQFDPNVLLKVVCQVDSKMTKALLVYNLNLLVKAGVVRRTSDEKFRFCHPQIHQAAYNTIPGDKNERQLIHLQLGYILQSIFDSDHGVFFSMLRQLNLGSSCLDDQRIKLAKLNLEAGKQCSLQTSPLLAVEYLQTARDLLGSDEEQWTNHYDLALQLSNMTAEMYWSCGRLSGVKFWADEVSNRAVSVHDSLSSKLILMQALVTTDVDGAIDLGLSTLKEMGFNIRERPKSYHMYPKLYKTKRRLRKLKDEEITRLPICADDGAQKAMKLMGLVILYAHRSQSIHRSGNKSFLPVLYCKLIACTLRHGISPYSSYCFACYGSMNAVLGFMEEATRYSNIALTLMEKAKKTDVRAATLTTVYSNVRHWKTTYSQCVNQFLLAYEAGKTSGHTFQGLESAYAYSICYFVCGYPLGRLASDLKNFCIQAKDYREESLIGPLQTVHSMTLNMLSQGNQLSLGLTGTLEGTDSDRSTTCERFVGLLTTTRIACQMELAFLLGSFEDMERVMDARERIVKNHVESRQCFIGFVRETFIAGLILIRLSSRDFKYRPKANHCLRMLEKWETELGEVNTRHYVLTLHAFFLSLFAGAQQNSRAECSTAFEEAIAAARQGGYQHDEAMANELAAEFFFGIEETILAEAKLTRGYQLYLDWQAKRKVQQLQSKYKFLQTITESDDSTFNLSTKNPYRRTNRSTSSSVMNKKVSFADSQTERSADSTLEIVDPTISNMTQKKPFNQQTPSYRMALSDKALQAQWAGSGDFWPAIPDGPGSIVCIQTRVRKAKDERVLPNQIWPEVVCASTLFGLSGCKPRGRIVPDDVNQKQNNLMKRDITETISAQWPMATFWDSASVWENGGREPGFIVALSHRKNQSDDIDKFRDWIVNLAKNYDQGAIYEYRCINRRLFRSTISVLTPESEADVEIVIASRSVLRQAE